MFHLNRQTCFNVQVDSGSLSVKGVKEYMARSANEMSSLDNISPDRASHEKETKIAPLKYHQ